MSEDIKVILGRIKKLLAHAKSAKEIGSIAEAEAFMAKVQELLDKQAAAAHATAKQVNPAALIYIRKDELAVDQFLKGKIHNTPGMQGRPRNMDGYNRGKAVGGSVALMPNRFEGARGRAGRLLSAAC